ncbi:sulfatase-like hydrolase/transferase, partial [Photobacterium sp. OFAV2-7]|uniref:sulfatase-like hydrolase/transferase n=1 Tax=Photobacterium sp. OFAV2-7 TaxID=2917748 RepID=UPI001EF4020E
MAKYKVLDYMSDTINFTIAKNIAGGSLLSAIGYVADEGFIFIVFLAIAMLLYWVGHKLVVKAANSCTSPATKGGVLPFKRMASGYLFFLLGFVLLAMQVKQYDNVRYGAVKKNSYVALTSLLDMASDFDQDGYGYFSFPEDGAMFDARVYPGAVDVPGNHVDEDMLLGDFTLTDVDYELDYSRVIPQFDYVFFVVLESTRGDVLEKRVNNHIVAPNLLKLSRQGAVFPNVYSHTGFTAASLKAMFNGELTAHHHQQSIFEILQTVGYQVNVISGQAESFANISKETNMNTTATHFFDAATNIEDRVYANTSLGSLRLGEDVVVSAVNKRLDKVKGTNKQFFYINFQAAHFPYHYEGMKNLLKISPIPRSRISPANKAWLEDTYWNAVAAADHAVGQLMLKLEELGIYDQSLIVVTADHGESLFDDGVLGHGHKINDQQ